MTTTTNHETDARLLARYLHLLHAVKAQQLALYAHADDEYPDDHHLSFLVTSLNKAWGDLVGPLASELGIQSHDFDLPADCMACLAAGEPCDGCAEARYDELVTTVYSAARGVLEGWGIAVDSAGDTSRVGEEIDEGMAHELWAWVAGRMPGIIAKAGAA